MIGDNGEIKVTLIESFDGRAKVVSKGFKLEFPDLWAAKRHIADKGWTVNVWHLAGGRRVGSMMNKWWAYLHENGKIQVKRWLGDHKDYTDDCIGNPFVIRVVPPFDANTREEAEKIATESLK